MDPYNVVEEQKHPRLHLFLRTSFQSQISDIRCILRLPYAHLKAGCNLAVASLLFSLIGGVSTCLYNASYEDFVREKPTGSGEKFKGVLRDFYPWEDEQLPIDEAIRTIYDSHRNPIEHCLALYKPDETRRSQIVKTRLTPKQIAEIERSEIRPPWLPPMITLSQSGFCRYDINILSLYWGVFRLINSLLKDKEQLGKSEEFQMHLWDDYTIKGIKETIELLKSIDINLPEYVEQAAVMRYRLAELNGHKLTEKQQQAVQAIEIEFESISTT